MGTLLKNIRDNPVMRIEHLGLQDTNTTLPLLTSRR